MKLKLMLLALCSVILSQCKSETMKTTTEEKEYEIFVGTYTNEYSKGIYKYSMKVDGTIDSTGLMAETSSPSFLAITHNGEHLLAVNEISREDQTGTVESYQIHSDSLERLSQSSSGGAHPCYITVNKNGVILVSNYTGGNLGLLNITEKGELTELLDVEQHEGKGTTDRQESPHAHSVWFEPNSEKIISVDLGTNELWFSKLNESGDAFVSREPGKLPMAEGAGPRHMVFHPNNKWIYVVNELNATVTQVIKDGADYKIGQTIETLPADFNEFNLCADIHISSDGKFLYASNRGHHSIVIYAIDSDNGEMTLLGHQSTHGEWPRNFSLTPDEKYILVANQNSNNLVSFKRNAETGLLEFVDETYAPSPVCVLFP